MWLDWGVPLTSVIIPALNEAENIEYVIRLAAATALVDEIIVVDDGSIDDTREIAEAAGARVVTSSLLGKGASMEDGLREARGEWVVFLDGDLRGLDAGLIEKLIEPLRSGQADFVKARFSRHAGRVTTLTAKPLLATFFPELAHFTQPLGGIIAARRTLLEALSFESDYGVDLALLIDASFVGARLAEVDIGHLEHDQQSLNALGEMAKQVVRVLLHRAHKHERLSIRQVREVEEVERQAHDAFASMAGQCGQSERLALFDMDGTLVQERSVLTLARRADRIAAIAPFLDNPTLTPEQRTTSIAAALKGVPQELFRDVARNLTLSPGAAETVIALRKRGFRVGIVSDAFRLVTEIVRRRVFADFSVANLLRFDDGQATGQVTPSPLFRHEQGCSRHDICKWNVLQHLEDRLAIPANRVLAVGDSGNDVCLLRRAGLGVAYEPKSEELRQAAAHVIHGDMRQVLAFSDVL